MKNFIGAVVVLALWLPGFWLYTHFDNEYRSIENAPIIGIFITIALFLAPWYIILGRDGAYLQMLEKMLEGRGHSSDEDDRD